MLCICYNRRRRKKRFLPQTLKPSNPQIMKKFYVRCVLSSPLSHYDYASGYDSHCEAVNEFNRLVGRNVMNRYRLAFAQFDENGSILARLSRGASRIVITLSNNLCED